MNRGIYTAASGMTSLQHLMDVVTNNLANVSTTGYKRDSIAFSETMEREMVANAGTGKSLGSIGIANAATSEQTNFEAGSIQTTGRPLDVAIQNNEGMFAVQTPQGTRYTRDGSFQLDQDGKLVTVTGDAVLDDRNQPITAAGKGKVQIDPQGNILAGDQVIAKLGVFTGQFSKEGSNLFQGSNPTLVTQPSLVPSALEGSNVNAIQSMVEMIQLSRMYEMSQRSIQSQDDQSQKLIQSLQ